MKLPSQLGLLFAWPSRHNIHLALPLMIFLALLLHVAGIAAFQILPPQSRPNPERSAQVWFLSPSSPDYVSLLPLLAASDPALFSPGRASGRLDWKLPETVYTPSFDTDRPKLEPLPALADATLPPIAPLAPIRAPLTTQPATANPAKPVPGLPTTVKLAGGLTGWTLIPRADAPAFSAQQNKGLPSTTFLIALSPDGAPLHVFPDPDRTSGNETLDRAALRYLLFSRYQPPSTDKTADTAAEKIKDAGTAWGTATFLWGADVLPEETP